MKLLNKLIMFLLLLLFILTGLILLTGINPELTDKISSLLYRNQNESSDALSILVDDPESDSISGDSISNKDGGPSENILELPDQPDGANEEQTTEYQVPDEDAITIPDDVAGKSGYQPVQGNEEQIDEAAEEQLKEQLGTGETGEGLTFDALFYPYYEMLGESEKQLYRQVYANANALNLTFAPVRAVSVAQIRNVFSAVYNDHPELFWLDTAYSGKFSRSGELIEIQLQFNRTADNIEVSKAEFEQNANEILSNAVGLSTDYEKEKFVHNALISQITYQLSAPMNQSAYSGLVTDQTVCAGYARAFQYLMQRLGIPCYYVTGYAGENHAWNIVKLDDGFYNVDLTWDDTPGAEYDYFNRTDQDFAATHIRKDLSVYLPACNGQNYRNLEQSSSDQSGTDGGNADTTGYTYRRLEETGVSQDYVATNLEQYFGLCYQQMMQSGIGNYSIQNVLEGDALMQEWYQMHQNEGYKSGYLERAMQDLGAGSCQMQITIETLEGSRYLITHNISLQ